MDMLDNLDNSVTQVNIDKELKQSYLDYAMSVIVGRALPDVRDGLKPVHRRTLFAMQELSNYYNRPYKKSARIVGDVIGKYHPHGDSPVYDALVRMAQEFSMRYPLVDGQGNFGSIDGDSPAAMRYTEVRMSKITQEFIADIDKNAVDMVLNYDESESMPSVLPAKIPNLLINGSSGIAVGMATNILPHNITETINATLILLDNPQATVSDLMQAMQGPDFPTRAIIKGVSGIRQAYETGKGKVVVYARHHIQQVTDSKQSIVVTELPFQVNKARLLEKIADLVREKKITGISDIRDESNKEGIRVVLELKRGEVAEVVYNNLLTSTPLKTSYGINMVALVNNQPKQLGLKEVLVYFLQHRREVISRRSIFDLRKSRKQAHLLEGLIVAVANIDQVIRLIRESKDSKTAKVKLLSASLEAGPVLALLERTDSNVAKPTGLAANLGLQGKEYRLSEEQAQGILELRLHRLTGLEQEKLTEDYKKLVDLIIDLLDILSNSDRLTLEIRKELEAMRDQYGDERRTEIQADEHEIDIMDLISEEQVVITLSDQGYVKAQSTDEFRAQRRGGRGKQSGNLKELDIVRSLIIASNHDTILCFSNQGKVYWLRALDIPISSRSARGKPIVNLLDLDLNEVITTILPMSKQKPDVEQDTDYILMSTLRGVVKKTTIESFSRPRKSGLIAISLAEDDQLVQVLFTSGDQLIMMLSDSGKITCFRESDIRSMGRSAAGVRGMMLQSGDQIVATLLPKENDALISVCENGYGKISPIKDFPVNRRGGKGVIGIQTSSRNGKMVAGEVISDEQEFLLISDKGVLVRTRVQDVPSQSRNTQGVRLMRLQTDDKVIALSLLPLDEIDDAEEQ